MKSIIFVFKNWIFNNKKKIFDQLLIHKNNLVLKLYRVTFWKRNRTQEVIFGLQGKKVKSSVKNFIEQLQPKQSWHSWDSSPWNHPWLTSENLLMSRNYEKQLIYSLSQKVGNVEPDSRKYAFVGNIANNMTLRALPLRAKGYNIDIFLHTHDDYLLSYPGWEISDQIAPEKSLSYKDAANHSFKLPEVPGVYKYEINEDTSDILRLANTILPKDWVNQNIPTRYFRQLDVLRWPGYTCYSPYVESFQKYDAIFAAQVPYLAYLSQRPYLVSQVGGELWFDASRGDAFGMLTRESYKNAKVIMATNPWAYANARRYGFNHVVYAPLMINTNQYSPNRYLAKSKELRDSWKKKTGGNFFVLSTARIDKMWKNSDVGLEGFYKFAKQNKDARLVTIAWGEDKQLLIEYMSKYGLENRIIFLPLSGKLKIIEYLCAADCLLDQFKIGYYGATALEAMACGLPVIMHLLSDQYDALCPTGAPPILNACNSDEVARNLIQLAKYPDRLEQVSLASRKWILDNHSVSVWENTYGVLLAASAANIHLDFSNFPLSEPLSMAEKEYHAQNLLKAPLFPNYIV